MWRHAVVRHRSPRMISRCRLREPEHRPHSPPTALFQAP
jgi:hypothetical protein